MNQRFAVIRSVTIVSVSSNITYVIGFIVSIFIARTLEPADFGRYAFTIWLCGWLINCSNHALPISSIKFIAEADGAGKPDAASHIANFLSQIQRASSFIVIALFVVLTAIIQPQEWRELMLPVTGLIIIAVVAKANYNMLVAIGKGQAQFEPEAITSVAAGAIGLILVIGASATRAGLLDFIGIFAVSQLLLNLLNRIAYRRYCRPFSAGPIPKETLKRIYRHLKLTAVLALLYAFRGTTIEMLLLNTFATTIAVGYFAIAVMLTRGAVQLFSVGLTSTLMTYMAMSFGQRGPEQAVRLLGEATRFYWSIGLAIAGLGLVVTRDIVTLMYGDAYVDAVPVIEAILVLAGMLLITNGIVAFQTVVDRQDDRIRVTLGALAANAILGFALIPPLGLTGAVLSYAGGMVTDLALSIFYLRRATPSGIPVARMARLLGVGVLATAAAWLTTEWLPGHYAFIPGAFVFVIVYVPASVLVNYWTDDDYRLMDMIADRLGRPGRLLMRMLKGLHRIRSAR